MAIDWNWKEKLALLWRGGVRVQAGLQPCPPSWVKNPAVPEKEKDEADNGPR